MSSPGYSALTDWYLARLRIAAQEMKDANLTPRTLLEADFDLIRKLVQSRAEIQDKQYEQIVARFRAENRLMWIAELVIYLVGFLGTVVFCVLYLI